MKKLLLASSSPYRRELLERLGIPFETYSPNIDEDSYKSKISDPVELALTLSDAKAMAALAKFPDYVVIGSDQLGQLEGQILGKPYSIMNAAKQLRLLAGKTHQLITAVTIASKSKKQSFHDITKLKMKNLNEKKINFYLNKDNPVDCAGSYKLEQYGISLFNSIESQDHTAIIGLPLIKTGLLLEEFGFSVPPEK